jgi:hypothetical protein
MKCLLVCLAIVLSLALQAQPVAWNRDDCMPKRDCHSEDVILLYLSLRELPLQEQRQQMWALSSRTKAAVWKYNIIRYLEDHPQLDAEARSILLEGSQLIARPGWFDTQVTAAAHEVHATALHHHKQRAERALPAEMIYEVFIRLGPEPSQTAPGGIETPSTPASPSFGPRTPRVEQVGCTCASYYECWFLGLGCHTSWCEPQRHCGFYNNEECWGRCKLSE